MAIEHVRFKEQSGDDASEAFRIASEGDRPVRVLVPLLPNAHECYRNGLAVARRAAHRAAREASVATPELRWFKEHFHPWETERIVCGGMVIRGYDILWLNIRGTLGDARGLEQTVGHEVGHLAGLDGEHEADAFADRIFGQGSAPACRDSGGDIEFMRHRPPVSTNVWELRSA